MSPLLSLSLLFPVWVGADGDVRAQIDAVLRQSWQLAHITPAPMIGDAGFARRTSLDLTGRLPSVDRLQAFLADRAEDKRAKWVDELLASEAYAIRWADYWDALLMGRATREAFLNRDGFHGWLKSEFAANTPWDQLVTKLITAEGYNTNRRPRGAADDPKDFAKLYNPAVNWFLRYSQSIPELSGATAKTFLGVQLQCAQCHDHKTEKWKQEDFKQFTAFFTKTWPTYYDKTLVVGVVRLELKDRIIPPPANPKFQQYFGSYQPYVASTPRFLNGSELGRFRPRRTELAKWMTAKNNPWFAKAFANRMWGVLLGRGFVEPVDDFRDSNPPLAPEALDVLAKEFANQNYDIRKMLRLICSTEAYQRECVVGTTPALKLWAAYPVKPLDVEPLFEVITQATGANGVLQKVTKGNINLVRTSWVRQFVAQMGTDDMAEVVDSETTIAKMLASLNGSLINSTARAVPGLGLTEILQKHRQPNERLDQLYLCTLSRYPSQAERSAWLAFLKAPRKLVSAPGPVDQQMAPRTSVGGQMTDAADADFRMLASKAKTAADFKALAGKMRNNADAGLFVKAFEEWTAEEPFRFLAAAPGAKSAEQQAWEDIFWAILNSTEFTTNH